MVASPSWRTYTLAVVAAAVVGLIAAVSNGQLVLLVAPVAVVGIVAWALRASLGAVAVAVLFVALLFDNVAERPGMGLFKTPLHEPGRFLYTALAYTLKIPGLKLFGLELLLGFLLLLVLVRGPLREEARCAAPARGLVIFCALAGATVLAFEAYGLARGGDLNLSMLQVRPLLLCVTLPILWGLCFRRYRSIHMVLAAFTVAAFVRACFGIYYWAVIVRHGVKGPVSLGGGTYVMTHSDSVLAVVVLLICIVMVYERPSVRSFALTGVVFPVVMLGIIVNNRRLAIVALVMALFFVYLVADRFLKRRVHLTLTALTPLFLVYVLAGWSSDAVWARPVQTIKSVTEAADSSAQTRDVENYNLTVTMKRNPFFGSGFGHEYVEFVKMHDISDAFEAYRYVPHNSILGLLGFTGPIGFTGIWLVFLAGSFFAARTYRFARTEAERLLCLVTIGAIITHGVQAFGDMGIHSFMAALTTSPLIGLVGVAAVRTGAWRVGGLSVPQDPPEGNEPPTRWSAEVLSPEDESEAAHDVESDYDDRPPPSPDAFAEGKP